MTRWTQLYDELAGPRYPALQAYTALLTGDREAADALVHAALRRTFARPRRLEGIGQAEHHVRRAIVTGFLAGARKPAPASLSDATALTDNATAPSSDEPTPAHDKTPPSHDEGERVAAPEHGAGANPYAPPAPGDEPAEFADAPAPPAVVAWGDEEAEPARASAAETERRADANPDDDALPRGESLPDEEAQLRAMLQRLEPHTRAVAVLRHHDGLTPGQIAEQLGLPIDAVRAALGDVRSAVSSRLGIVLADEVEGADGLVATEVTVADHAARP